jgi:uncharacterized protein DUF5677
LRQALDSAFPKEARIPAPERAIFPLGVACRDLFEEVIFSVSAGFGRLALRTVRTMYECVIFARYLDLHPEKTADYLAAFYSQWAMFSRNIPDAENSMPEVHRAILEQVPQYAAGKRISLEWSDKKTLKMAKDVNIPSQFHAFAFNYASAYIHPGAAFILRHISQVQPGGVIVVSTRPQDHEAIFALRLSHVLILNALDLRLKYAPSTASSELLEECRKDFVGIWGYQLPI